MNEELRSMCDMAMKALMEQESFNADDFYKHLRGHGLPARQIKDLCEATFNDYLEVGYIERCGAGRFRKVQSEG
jgi:hypothetical protein